MRPARDRLALRVAVTAVLLGGCGLAPVSPAPSLEPSPTSTPVASSSPLEPTKNPVQLVTIDETLLGVFPATLDGLTLAPSPEGEDSLGDPEVGWLAERGASAIAVDPVTGDFVYAVILALRPDRLDDAHYRDWRDSFDEGACSQAGGVVGHAEAEIGGHATFIGTCAGGLHTYHAWLAEPGLLVSASAVGDARLGEALIAGLRP